MDKGESKMDACPDSKVAGSGEGIATKSDTHRSLFASGLTDDETREMAALLRLKLASHTACVPPSDQESVPFDETSMGRRFAELDRKLTEAVERKLTEDTERAAAIKYNAYRPSATWKANDDSDVTAQELSYAALGDSLRVDPLLGGVAVDDFFVDRCPAPDLTCYARTKTLDAPAMQRLLKTLEPLPRLPGSRPIKSCGEDGFEGLHVLRDLGNIREIVEFDGWNVLHDVQVRYSSGSRAQNLTLSPAPAPLLATPHLGETATVTSQRQRLGPTRRRTSTLPTTGN